MTSSDLVSLVAPWIEKLTLISFLSWGVIAFARGWVVPWTTHDALRADRDDWRARADRMAQIAEAALRQKVGA